tara:strand:+ start:131 stop:334 length:204 start_codon:yes stop_codon:yes gene_type:complete
VVRAQADQETKVITARHGILRPSLASADAVRAALADPSLERLRLRLRRVLTHVETRPDLAGQRGPSG